MAEKSLRDASAISTQELDELSNQKKLLDCYKAVSAGKERKSFAIALFLVVLGLLTILLNKVNATFVEFEVLSPYVSITNVSDKPLLMPTSVESITISGNLKVVVPQGGNIKSYGARKVELKLVSDGAPPEQLASLSRIAVDFPIMSIEDPVRIASKAGRPDISLSFCTTHEPLTLKLRGDINIVIDQRDQVPFSSARMKTAEVIFLQQQSSSKSCVEGVLVDLEMKLDKRENLNFNSNLKIDSLSLLDNRMSELRSKKDYSPMSAIESGKLLLHELGGKKIEISRRQRLKMEGVDGYLRNVSFEESGFLLLFEGNVKELSTGPKSNPFSLMPSYLEWIVHRESLTLLWSSVLSLFGLVFGLIKWFFK